MADSTNVHANWFAWIGRRVCVKETLHGTLRYFGETSFSSGFWCGVELDDSLGKNNGMVNNVRYFTCRPNFGIFVPVSKISKINENLSRTRSLTCEKDQNQTFGVLSYVHSNTPEVKLSTDLDSYVCGALVDEAIKRKKEKLLNSRFDSEESLGILPPDVIGEFEASWDSLDFSFSNMPLPSEIENISDSVFEQTNLDARNENFFDKIDYPKFASTPRQVKPKFVDYVNVLEDSLSLHLEEEVEEKKVVFVECAQNEPDVLFDIDKLKNNPNLSSTSNTLLNFDSEFKSLNKSVVSSEGNAAIDQQNNFNTTQILSNQTENFINEQDKTLNATYELIKTATSLMPDKNGSKESFCKINDVMINTQINERINKYQNLSDNLNKDFSMGNKLNLNATVELKCVDNVPQEHSKNEGEYLRNNSLQIDEVHNSVFSETSYVKQGDAIFDTTINLEKTFVIGSTLKNTFLNNTVKKNANVSKKVAKENIENECFTYKSKFLEEIASPPNLNSLSDFSSRNSICLPVEPKKAQQKQACDRRASLNNRKSSCEFDLNSTFCLLGNKSKGREKSSSLKNRANMSALGAASKNKQHENVNSGFKKPFLPNTSTRSLKPLSKSQASIISKGKENKYHDSKKGDLEFTKSTCNLAKAYNGTKVTLINKRSERSIPSVTSAKSSVQKNISNKHLTKSRLSFTFPGRACGDNFSDKKSPVVHKRVNFLNATSSLPLNKENKENSSESTKYSSDFQSKIGFKTLPARSESDLEQSKVDIGNFRKSSLSSRMKIVEQINSIEGDVSQCSGKQGDSIKDNASKHLVLQSKTHIRGPINTNKSKLPEKIHKPSFYVSDGNQPRIPRRNSLAVYSKEKLPVGIIKPRYSILQPIIEVNRKLISETTSSSVSSNDLEELEANGRLTSKVSQSLNRSTKIATSEKGYNNYRQIKPLSRKKICK